MKIKRIGILLVLFTLSPAMYYLKHGFFAPTDIATFNIDLTHEHSYVIKVDFQTHNGHSKGNMAGKVGPYTISLNSPSLKPLDYEKNKLWKTISERYHNKEPSGEILFEWQIGDSSFSQKCNLGFKGHYGFGNGYGICVGIWLPSTNEKVISDLRITVVKVDTFLVQNLKSPKIWIYRGGGK